MIPPNKLFDIFPPRLGDAQNNEGPDALVQIFLYTSPLSWRCLAASVGKSVTINELEPLLNGRKNVPAELASRKIAGGKNAFRRESG